MRAIIFVLFGLLGLCRGDVTITAGTTMGPLTAPERRVLLRPNDFAIGPFTVVTAVAANKDPKVITIASNSAIFVPGTLPAGNPTSVTAVLGAGLVGCPLVRDNNNTLSNTLILILPANNANCFFGANAVVSQFILPAQWMATNPAPTFPATTVQLTITTTDNVNAVVAAPTNVVTYTTIGQVIIPQSTGQLGPQGADQLLFGATPNNFRAAPFITPTAADAALASKQIRYWADRAIFLTPLAAATPTTVAVQLFTGATACTLTRSTADTTGTQLVLTLPDGNANCVFKANDTIQAFTLPQGWLRPNPSAGLISVEVYATLNGLDDKNAWSSADTTPPNSVFYYSTSDYAALTCANVNNSFTSGKYTSVTALSATQRVAIFNSLSATTTCDYPQFRLAMIVLPTVTPVLLTLPSSTLQLATMGWWNVPAGGAQSIFSTFLPSANAFTVLGIPAPSATNSPATVTVFPTQSMVIVGNTGAVGSTIFANFTQPLTTVGTAVSQPADLPMRTLLAVGTVTTFDAAGALVTPIVEITVRSSVAPGLVLVYNNQSTTYPWVSMLDYGTVVYLGHNDWIVRVPAMGTLAIYSALGNPVDSGNNDALFALLVLLIIPVLCCLAGLYAAYYFLFLKKKKTPEYMVGPNPVMEPVMMAVPPYFPGPYSMPMPGTPMYM